MEGKRKSAREFKVALDGIELSAEDQATLHRAIQHTALTQIAAMDTGGDFAALALGDDDDNGGGKGGGKGGTKGIRLVALAELQGSLPDLEGVLAEFRRG